jgi:tRNA-dihydrouridine synthase A
MLNRRISIAPMMEWTDRHYRFFARQITTKTLLYTEMITTGAILHGDFERYLRFDAQENPIAVQLGGSDPSALTKCARICEDFGYDEINLNVGCPSDRVQVGKIGACLMAEPNLVAECINAMSSVVDIPVTIKHRIGIDDLDSYENLFNFVSIVAGSGCDTFIVHARKAILSGLSPKQNRSVPPLNYPMVYQLKQDFPELEVIINGGILTLDEAEQHLKHVDGVMIGREAYHNPFILSEVDSRFYASDPQHLSRMDIIQNFIPYIQGELDKGVKLQHITRHILGLFHAQPNGKLWRRYLSENAHKSGASIEVVKSALKLISNTPEV